MYLCYVFKLKVIGFVYFEIVLGKYLMLEFEFIVPCVITLKSKLFEKRMLLLPFVLEMKILLECFSSISDDSYGSC